MHVLVLKFGLHLANLGEECIYHIKKLRIVLCVCLLVSPRRLHGNLMSCPKFSLLMKLELFACAAGPVLSRAEQDVE